MEIFKKYPDTKIGSSLIKYFWINERNLQGSIFIYETLIRHSIKPDLILFMNLIKSCIENKSESEALSFLTKMINSYSIIPDMKFFSQLLNHSLKYGATLFAISLFEMTINSINIGFKLNKTHCWQLLKANTKDSNLVDRIHKCVIKSGFENDIYVETTIIKW